MQKHQGIFFLFAILALFHVINALPTAEPPFKLPGLDLAKGILDKVEEGVGSGVGQMKGLVGQVQSQVSTIVDTVAKQAAAMPFAKTSSTEGPSTSGDASPTVTGEAAPEVPPEAAE